MWKEISQRLLYEFNVSNREETFKNVPELSKLYTETLAEWDF